jgi:uncharacterized membrane protein
VNTETIDLVKFLFVFLVLAAGSLSWAENNGHKPTKVIPILIGYVAFSAILYVAWQHFFAEPTYIEIATREALLNELSGWIIVGIFAVLCFLFILRMLLKSQGQHAQAGPPETYRAEGLKP